MTTRTLLATVIVVGSALLARAGQSGGPPAVFTDAQAAEGRTAYESVCVNCHTYAVTGRNGDPGELPAISDLADTFRNGIQQAGGKIPPLAGEAFLTRWGARTTQSLSMRIIGAMDAFPPAGSDDKTANNLTAYFLKVSGARAGAQELGTPGTTEVLIRELTGTATAR